MATTISVPYQIKSDGQTAGISEANPPGAPAAKVVFTCAANDRYTLVGDLVGRTRRSGKKIIREYPFKYPPSPNLICTAIESIELFGKPMLLGFGPQWLGKNMAKVTATFTVPTWDALGQLDASGQPYTTTTFSIGAEKLTAPQSVYRFSDGQSTQTPLGINIPLMQIDMKRHFLPYVPLAEIAALSGSVNAAPLVFLDYTFATGTVLFLGGDVQFSFDTLGNIAYEATYRISWRAKPWNQFLSPDPRVGYQPIADHNGAGSPPYPGGDFGILP